MSDDQNHYPRALSYLEWLLKDAIIRWLTDSEIGKTALKALEKKLVRHDAKAVPGDASIP